MVAKVAKKKTVKKVAAKPAKKKAVKKVVAKKTGQKVFVVSGIHDINVAANKQTVADLRKKLTKPLNIAGDAKALVNGDGVPDEARYVLRGGDRVEFVRDAGQKG